MLDTSIRKKTQNKLLHVSKVKIISQLWTTEERSGEKSVAGSCVYVVMTSLPIRCSLSVFKQGLGCCLWLCVYVCMCICAFLSLQETILPSCMNVITTHFPSVTRSQRLSQPHRAKGMSLFNHTLTCWLPSTDRVMICHTAETWKYKVSASISSMHLYIHIQHL